MTVKSPIFENESELLTMTAVSSLPLKCFCDKENSDELLLVRIYQT